MSVLRLLVGGLLLTLGRKLFWLFVAGVGFLVGAELATRWLHLSQALTILVALGAGLLGALVAVSLQKLAVGIAGFVAGGLFSLGLVRIFDLKLGLPSWVFFVVGGILGAVLIALLFEWALIILSSLTGASFVADSLQLDRPESVLVVVLGFIVGMFVQAAIMRAERRRTPPAPSQPA